MPEGPFSIIPRPFAEGDILWRFIVETDKNEAEVEAEMLDSLEMPGGAEDIHTSTVPAGVEISINEGDVIFMAGFHRKRKIIHGAIEEDVDGIIIEEILEVK